MRRPTGSSFGPATWPGSSSGRSTATTGTGRCRSLCSKNPAGRATRLSHPAGTDAATPGSLTRAAISRQLGGGSRADHADYTVMGSNPEQPTIAYELQARYAAGEAWITLDVCLSRVVAVEEGLFRRDA